MTPIFPNPFFAYLISGAELELERPLTEQERGELEVLFRWYQRMVSPIASPAITIKFQNECERKVNLLVKKWLNGE